MEPRVTGPTPQAAAALAQLEEPDFTTIDENARHAHRNSSNYTSLAAMGLVEHEFAFYEALCVEENLREEMDIDAYIAILSTQTGLSRTHLLNRIFAMDELIHRLPTVLAVQRRSYPLTMEHLIKLTNKTRNLSDDELAKVEHYLGFLVSAKHDGEVLPTPLKLSQLAEDTINTVCGIPQKIELIQRGVTVNHLGNGNSHVDIICSSVIGEVVDRAIKRIVNTNEDMTRAEAFEKFITEKIDFSIELNYIQAVNEQQEFGPIFMPDAGGVVPDFDIERWAEKIREGKDLTDVQHAVTDAYEFTPDMRKYEAARDETCRFPNCTCRVSKCDLDHCVNYADGGPTSPDNSGPLCRPHHNLKTAGLLHYRIYDNGVIHWVLPDGTTALSLPSGFRRIRMRTIANMNAARVRQAQEDIRQQRDMTIEWERDDNILHLEDYIEIVFPPDKRAA